MRALIIAVVAALAAPAFAQGSGSSGSGAAPAPPQGSGAASEPVPAPAGSGSAAADSGSGSGSSTAQPAPPTEPPITGDAQELRRTCAAAMNANPEFADAIIHQAEVQLGEKVDRDQVIKDRCTLQLHEETQQEISTNKRHVLYAYIAMWLVAVGFVLFLWKRQQLLKTEILQLRRELDAATKDDK